MKLKELLEKYLQTSYDKADSINYITKHKIDINIPQELSEFIEKINGNELIKEKEFHLFSKQLSRLNEKAKECIIHLLSSISFNKYKEQKENIKNAVMNIERNLAEGKKLPKSSGENAANYIGILNCYQLFAHHVSIYEGSNYFTYPGVTRKKLNNIIVKIPFALNALRLVGELPTTDNFNGFNLSKPFYPLQLDIIKAEVIGLKKGVKRSDDYFPYKMVKKIARGATGDNTFVATNGKKILFVRGVEDYSPDAVLASKIATLVSPQHFSSERLLDNRLVGSRKISTFAVSLADDHTLDPRNRYIEQEKRIFPGSGIIDEVTNFIDETDPNIENYGLSSTDVYQSHLTKIDFDRCSVTSKMSKKEYERDILTRSIGGIYRNLPHIHSDPDYIKEKLFARLKLSMLTKELLRSLANKAFAPEDAQSRDRAVKECMNRSTIALKLFFKHNQTKDFLHQDPTILNQCYHQIAEYIATHFAAEDQELLQYSLRKRVEAIQVKVKKKLGIKLTLTDYVRLGIEEVSAVAEPIVAQGSNSFIEPKSLMKVQAEPEVAKSESTFLSRNWLKLLDITTLGKKTADEEHRVSNVEDNEEALKPSPDVQNLIQQVEVARQLLDNEIVRAENALVQIHKKSTAKTQDPEQDVSSKFEA